MNHEEVAEITEREIEKFNNLNNFARFIDLSIFYYFFLHKDRCQHILCSNCTFLDKLKDIYLKMSTMRTL